MESPQTPFAQVPYANREDRPRDPARARGKAEDGPALDCRVLVVEDDDATLEAVAELLEGEGVSVCKAHNGREALDRLHQSPVPGLIIVDLMMPVMDGWEVCRRIAEE